MFEILRFFPNNISEILKNNIKEKFDTLEEIRMRTEKPIILKFSEDETIIPYKLNRRRNYKNSTNTL